MQPTAHAIPHPGVHEAHHEELDFWRKYVFSTDHKIIGIQYGVTALFFLFFGFCLMLMMRWQIAHPGKASPRAAHAVNLTLYLLSLALLGSIARRLVGPYAAAISVALVAFLPECVVVPSTVATASPAVSAGATFTDAMELE